MRSSTFRHLAASTLFLSFSAAASAQRNPEGYVGQAGCETCHEEIHAKWSHSRHSKMVQPATRESVRGNFHRESIRLRGKEYGLRTEGGKFYIMESFFGVEPREHEVLYTLGNRRIQHYLTKIEDGRIIVLPPSWDVLRKEWFHNLEIAAPDQQEGEIPVQVWNKNCFGCHVSNEVKNYDAGKRSYETEWIDFGTSCERCHGPGERHVERYRSTPAPSAGPSEIVVPTKLDPGRGSMVCAQCHSFRDVLDFGFVAGEDYYDYFFPLLEYSMGESSDPTWWPDGKTRRFSTNALGLWQSECFLSGKLACTSCHVDPHEPEIETNLQLRPERRALCTRCHESIFENVEAHTFHPASSRGSDCVECHMPRSVFSIKTEIRDHSISIPAPENTARFGIPNGCNACHQDRSAEWAIEALERWYPGSTARHKVIHRAETFHAARERAPDAVDRLLAFVADREQGPLPRANAVGYLGRFDDPRVYAALVAAIEDPHPLVRSIAALGLGAVPERYRAPATSVLVGTVADGRRTVRMNAAISLLNLGVRRLGGDPGIAFEEAKRNHAERGAFFADDASQQLNLGNFHVLSGDTRSAAAAFENSYALNPDQPGIGFFMAVTRLSQERAEEARKLLEHVPADDPFAEPARELLAKLKRRQ